MTEQRVSSRSYPCDGCGAAVEYAAGTGTMRCPYCAHERRVAEPTRDIVEHAFVEMATAPPVATHVLSCPKCHAQFESDALSTRCQFCATALVVDEVAEGRIPPEAVVPFALDERRVHTAIREWASSRWFAPNSLKKLTHAEKIDGTYLPHWTFDAQTESDYEGERGEHYWVTETHTVYVDGKAETRTQQVRHTRWYPASGTVARAFDDILTPATSHVSGKQLTTLAPWPLGSAVPFQREYLAGFRTLRYDIGPDAGFSAAQEGMARVIWADCTSDIGGDEQRVHRVDTRYDDVTFKLVLLPVWIACYVHAGKTYPVFVNDATGEVDGDRPYSGVKIALAVMVALAVLAAIIAVIAMSG